MARHFVIYQLGAVFFFFTLQLTIFYWSRGENPSTKVEKDTTRNCKQASIDFGLQLAALL